MRKAMRRHTWRAVHDVAGVLHYVCEECGLGATLDLPTRKKSPDRAEGIPGALQHDALRRCDPDWLLCVDVLES